MGATRSRRMRSRALFVWHWFKSLNQPFPLRGLLLLPGFLKEWRSYARAEQELPVRFCDTYPCLGDRFSATPFDPHYFYQSAWIARRLHDSRPKLHMDVGSSVMTIGVLSAFLSLIFVDYRPLRTRQPGLLSVGGDIASLPFPDDSFMSISSLHVLEHIGLGRYGDSLDTQGATKAAAELVRVLKPGGRLYLSVPVGRERVCFNAHRVFAPNTVLQMLAPLSLLRFCLVDDDGQFVEDASIESAANLDYGCGLFEMRK